ncbi:MAG: YiiD C-terminal domain-containing protein [Gammaproteobacteria bacterium]|nr:YiiD C-terminal domain-containing protein [Gammaproteobacteria bacterium]
MSPQQLLEEMYRQIPLSAAMQVAILAADESQVRLAAPLAPNLNHCASVFGGSLLSLAILSSWALLRVALQSAAVAARVVIQDAQAEFLRPADAGFEAISRLPEADWPRFLYTLERHPRARILLPAEVVSAGQRVLRQRGVFVALREDSR